MATTNEATDKTKKEKVWKCNKCGHVIRIGFDIHSEHCLPGYYPDSHFNCDGEFALIEIEIE